MANPEEKINTLSDKIKISFILLFILFGFPPSLCFLSHSPSPFPQSTSAASWSPWKSSEHQALVTPPAEIFGGTHRLRLIDLNNKIFSQGAHPVSVTHTSALARSIPVHLCVTKPTLARGSSSMPILASTCVWKELLDRLQLSHRPRTKNSTTNDELELKSAEDGKNPAIVYTHKKNRESRREANGVNKVRKRPERRNKQRCLP